MRMRDGFEIVHVANEHIVVPVGINANSFNGMVILNSAASFLLENMFVDVTVDNLVSLLTEHYDVETDTARIDIIELIASLRSIGLVID